MNDIFGVFRPVFWTSPQCPQCFPIKSVPHKLKSHWSLSVNHVKVQCFDHEKMQISPKLDL